MQIVEYYVVANKMCYSIDLYKSLTYLFFNKYAN